MDIASNKINVSLNDCHEVACMVHAWSSKTLLVIWVDCGGILGLGPRHEAQRNWTIRGARIFRKPVLGLKLAFEMGEFSDPPKSQLGSLRPLG